MTGPLDGRVAVVTGGATGIGFAIVRRLLADGARIVLAGLTDSDVDTGLGRLGDQAGRGTGFAGDLSVPGTADRLLATAVAAFGQVDICVNNAGGGVIAPTLTHTEETLQATIGNNLWTTLRTCLAVLPHMAERGYGRIISDDLYPVRSFVAARAEQAGLTPPRISDLVLAVSELAANTLYHAGGGGTVLVWQTGKEIVCQVADGGRITDPLARHRLPPPDRLNGQGLWLVNQVCDLVQARTGRAGTTTRLHMRLDRP